MIRLDGLSIGYRSGRRLKVIASDMNALASDGTLTCLVGVNGIGKSTLIRTVAGFQKPLQGDVSVGIGNETLSVGRMTQLEMSKMISVVLTGRSDMTNLSAFDVVSFGRSPYTGLLGTLSDDDKSVIQRAMSLVGIEPLAMRDVGSLSDGELQKVMIAKALAQQTPIIVLDEPSAFLDYPSKEELMLLLAELAHNEGKTILLSSHDLDIVSRTADSFWIMERHDDGQVALYQDTTIPYSVTTRLVVG